MTLQFHDDLRNDWADRYESIIGTSPKLRYYTGAPPANCAAAPTGSLLVDIGLPSDWMTAASSGSKSKSGTWSATATGTGTIGWYGLWNNGLTKRYEQGIVTQAFALTTNALTAVNSNVLNFAATTGVTVGMNAYGTGVPSGAKVSEVGATTVKLDMVCADGVSSSTSILFGDTSGDHYQAQIAMTSGVTVVTVDAKTMTWPGA